MSTTVSDNQAENLALSIPHGLRALADHMIDHQLPAPHDLRLPRDGDDPFLTIWLQAAEAYDWLDADRGFAVDDITVVASVNGQDENVRYDGRLPDTGVRVRIQWSRPLTRTLTVVAP